MAVAVREWEALSSAILDEVERAVIGKRDALRLVLLGLLVAVTTAVPPRAAQRPRRRQLEATTLPQLDSITQAVSFAQASAFDLHYRLRPILREVAAARLARRGVVLDREPQRARALLGEPAWELVRPDREPGERFERGWAEADLVKVLEGLESV